MSVALGTRIRTGRDTVALVEQLFEGAEVTSRRGEDVAIVNRPVFPRLERCVKITTDGGDELICTPDHALLGSRDGAMLAGESVDQGVQTASGSARVTEAADAGSQVVFDLGLTWPGVYEANGMLCFG